MNQIQALNGIIICLLILTVIFIIYLISTYKKRREKRFIRKTKHWEIGDRIMLYKIDNASRFAKPVDTIYKLVGWNINNFVITDKNNTYTMGWLSTYKNVTAENRKLHNNCKTDMGIEPGFTINDYEIRKSRS
jgi:hypothetical protein